jgi:hypothetical protein
MPKTKPTEPKPFDFGAWVTDQAAKIEAAVRLAGKRGDTSTLGAWVVPSSRLPRGVAGYLHVGTEPPFFGADIVRLGPHGSVLARCPYSHIRSLLYTAAVSYHVLPIPADVKGDAV